MNSSRNREIGDDLMEILLGNDDDMYMATAVPRRHCKKTQLEILDEVHEKSERKRQVEIDHSDPIRSHNFRWLHHKKQCFVFATRVEHETRQLPNGEKIDIGPFESSKYLIGLSEGGEEYRELLAIEVREEQRKDEEIALSRRKNFIAEIALLVSLIALIVSWFGCGK